MTGKINEVITHIIKERSKGDEVIIRTTRTKLMLKGINPDQYKQDSPDDPAVLGALNQIAQEMGIKL